MPALRSSSGVAMPRCAMKASVTVFLRASCSRRYSSFPFGSAHAVSYGRLGS